jgi:hypothetical protein
MPRAESDRKYDDASWHSGGDFPVDVPYSQGGVHIAIFLAWVIRRGFYNPQLFETADVEMVQQRSVSILGLLDRFDEKLVPEELSDEGNAFARYYYGLPDERAMPPYLADYDRILGAGLPSLYHVAPTWENYAKLEPVIDQRYREWVAGGRPARPAGRAPVRGGAVRNVLAWIVGIVLFGLGPLIVLAWHFGWLHP